MYPPFHKQITREAIGVFFGEQELREVLAGNTGQDHLHGQIGHPEFHFDDSEFARTYAYLDQLKSDVITRIQTGIDYPHARTKFGRFTHALQDFYAHSNYIQLWAESRDTTPQDWDGRIDCQDDSILHSPRLISGHFYSPWELITFLPVIGRLFISLFPRDSHAYLNIDSPRNSTWFPLAYQAAVDRTRFETRSLLELLTLSMPINLGHFLGKEISSFKGV